MKHLFQLIGVFIVMLSCSPFKVASDYDKNVDFTQYKTYSFRLDDLKMNDIDQSRVLTELEKQLAQKGLTKSEIADLAISIKASHERVRNNYVTPSVHLGGWGRWIGWGIGMSRGFSTEQNRGNLLFDFIDTKTGKLVWQGTGGGINVDNLKSKDEQIPKIIAEMLKNYPPKK